MKPSETRKNPKESEEIEWNYEETDSLLSSRSSNVDCVYTVYIVLDHVVYMVCVLFDDSVPVDCTVHAESARAWQSTPLNRLY